MGICRFTASPPSRCTATPRAALLEPHYKHFSIERYRELYELRERGKVLVRVIFTLRPSGEEKALQLERLLNQCLGVHLGGDGIGLNHLLIAV